MKFAYVGCRTTKERNARGQGISVYKVNEAGNWQLKEIVPILENPSYLAFDKTGQFLYTVHGDLHQVSAFKIKEDGGLEFLNTVDAQGKNPVHIIPSKNNKFMFVATLQGGAVATLPRHEDGSLGEAISVEHLEGLTPEGVSHAHQCLLDNNEEYLFVPSQGRHIGYERLWVFKVDNETGKLTRAHIQEARMYDEPRHVSISPDNKRVYLINERGNCMTYYGFDDKTGHVEARQILPSLPETYTENGQASASLCHPSGKFVYGSNRIHESIVTYRVNENTGYLTLAGFTPVLGKTPRFMCFNEDATQLIVGNEDSDTIRFFDINQETGELTFADKTVETGSPTCVIFH